MNLTFKENREDIINYDIHVYNPLDRYQLRPFWDRVEIVERLWFPEYFKDVPIDSLLSEEDWVYLWTNYYLVAIKGNISSIFEQILTYLFPIYDRSKEIFFSIINPEEIIVDSDGLLMNSLLDVFLMYNTLEVTGFNLSLGVSLTAYCNLITLHNGFFLVFSNLFNDFSFMQYSYKIMDPTPLPRMPKIDDTEGPFNYTFFNIVKWIGGSIWEYYFPPKKLVFIHPIYLTINPEVLSILTDLTDDIEDLSIQEILVYSFLDNNFVADRGMKLYRTDFQYIMEIKNYEIKLEKNIAFYNNTLKELKELKDVEIDYKKTFKISIFIYFTYRFLAFLLKDYTRNDLIEMLALIEEVFFIEQLKKSRIELSKKDKKKLKRNDPIKNLKPIVNKFKIKIYTKAEFKDKYYINYILYNQLVWHISIFHETLSWMEREWTAELIDTLVFIFRKIFNFLYRDKYFENLIYTFFIKIYKKNEIFLQNKGWVKKKKYEIIQEEYPTFADDEIVIEEIEYKGNKIFLTFKKYKVKEYLKKNKKNNEKK